MPRISTADLTLLITCGLGLAGMVVCWMWGYFAGAKKFITDNFHLRQKGGPISMDTEGDDKLKRLDPIVSMTCNSGPPTSPPWEIRLLNRQRWPRMASYPEVRIAYHGDFFTVAQARIAIHIRSGPDITYYAEGICRLSPLDDPLNPGREKAWRTVLKKSKGRIKRVPPPQLDGRRACEKAIHNAISALHTRVMKHRSSFHHYRG